MKVEAFYRKRKQLSQYLPPSERHKLKVERPRPNPTQNSVNSPARTVIDKSNENSLTEAPNSAGTNKRRPSDPDSEMSGDSSREIVQSGNGNNVESVTNGEANQPPMKRSNTTNETPMNGNNGLEVS